MITKTLAQAAKRKMPAVIKEKGVPRYVVLDWATYRKLKEPKENFNGAGRLADRSRVEEFSPTLAQKKALARAEENLLKGKTLSYNELAKKLGVAN